MILINFIYKLIIDIFYSKNSKFKKIYKYPDYFSHRTNNSTMYIWDFQINKKMNISSKIASFIFKGNNYLFIDRYLSSLKISKYNTSFFQIENILCVNHEYSNISKNYSLEVRKNCDYLLSVKSKTDKIICAKYLLMIMNEVNYNDVNMVNYNLLVSYINENSQKEFSLKECKI